MNPEQLWETTMNPENRMLKQVHLENAAEADYTLSLIHIYYRHRHYPVPLGGRQEDRPSTGRRGGNQQADVYKRQGKLCIEVTQRIPILRIMSANGENYYPVTMARCATHFASGGLMAGSVFSKIAERVYAKNLRFDIRSAIDRCV